MTPLGGPKLQDTATRTFAAVILTAFLTLVAGVVGIVAAPLDDSMGTEGAPRGPTGGVAPRDLVDAPDVTAPAIPALPEYDLDEPRQWLQARSTAPRHPRVADRSDAGVPPRGFQARNPRIRVDAPTPGALAAIRETDGVAFATAAFVDEVLVRHEGGRARLDVAFVHAGGFRVFTPALTAHSEGVWRSVRDGDLALTHDAARALGVRAGDEVSLGSFFRRTDVTAGAAISLGGAGVADAVMTVDARNALAPDAEPVVLVGVERLDGLNAVIDRLRDAGVGEVGRLPDALPYRSVLAGDDEATVEAFEPLTFYPGHGGRIEIDPDWVDRNIVKADVPLLGEVECHRLIIPQLRAALVEIEARDLGHLLDVGDYGGCYVPRHISWDPGRGVSMHAWGISFDVNVHTNLYGDDPEIDPRLVVIFERHGFNWGGRWRTPDGMHFELGELQ